MVIALDATRFPGVPGEYSKCQDNLRPFKPSVVPLGNLKQVRIPF